MDANNHLWVADACNHRIQVFDANVEPPKSLFHWGEQGSGVGQMSYPYAIELLDDGNVMVCEFGNHRVQKFTSRRQEPWRLGNFWKAAGPVFFTVGNVHRQPKHDPYC